ncbi:distal tail [Citromicrobium phage vB_CbaS-RXM]|nr:distal tail [Citromicrobium phage vB_CbaS-RXM]
MPDFHDVIFPKDISYGSSGGPMFSTTIKELASGHEQRNINWSEARAKYDAKYGVKTEDQMRKLVDFFYARNGRAYGFRYFDHLDHQIVNQSIGTGDGTNKTFQLFKRYEPSSGYFFDRVIRKPIAGSLVLTVGGATAAATMDDSTGIITITGAAPAVGQDVRVIDCQFHVPVRFDVDHLDPAYDDYNQLSVPSIPLIEIRPR